MRQQETTTNAVKTYLSALFGLSALGLTLADKSIDAHRERTQLFANKPAYIAKLEEQLKPAVVLDYARELQASELIVVDEIAKNLEKGAATIPIASPSFPNYETLSAKLHQRAEQSFSKETSYQRLVSWGTGAGATLCGVFAIGVFCAAGTEIRDNRKKALSNAPVGPNLAAH